MTGNFGMKFFKSKVKKIESTSKYNLFVMSDIKNSVILIWEYYKDFMCIVLFCCFGKMIACELQALRTILLTDLFLKKNIYLAFLIFTVHLIKQLLQQYFVSLINTILFVIFLSMHYGMQMILVYSLCI